MTIKEFEDLGLTEEDGKLVVINGEVYFQFDAPVETISFTVTLKED